jgi:hypothetical protein
MSLFDRRSKKEKRISKFCDVIYGMSDILAYEMEGYKRHKVTMNVEKVCGLVNENNLHSEEIGFIRDMLHRLRSVSQDMNDSVMENYLNGKIGDLESNDER